MPPAIHPADKSVAVDRRGAGKLRGIFQTRRAPVLPETRCRVFFAPRLQSAIREEVQQIEIFEPHGFVARFVRICNATVRIAETRAERFREFGRTDYDEPDVDAGGFEERVDLAQLRERFTEERSTDVPQPYDQRGQRDTERSDFGRHCALRFEHRRPPIGS